MAINQDITNLPTPPNRSDSPSDFSDKADSFLGALPQLQTELNTYADEANSTQTAVNTSASNAATSEQNAAQSASDAEAFSDAAAALVNISAWDAGTTFNTNDAAIGSDGNSYRSLTDNNTGNDPVADDGTNWLQLTSTTPDLVLTPENVAPADGATGALLTPELEGSSYGSLYGVPMASARWQINTTSTFPEPTTETKAITVASGTLYEGGGSTGNVFYVDGDENPALTLERGSTYVFDQSDASNTGHPLRIQTTSDTQYTDGVTVEGTPGSAGAKTIFVVPLDAPTDLEYYCTVHGLGMGGPITTEALTDVEDTLVTGTATTYTTESLSPDSQFFWRVQYADTDGVTSDFSEATTFTTANIFTAQPTITAPADGATDIAEQPIIESSAFNTVNGSDTHVASQWVITRTSDGVDVFDSGEDTSNLESIQVPAGILDEGGENYTVKVRHKGSTYGFSAYSPDIAFTTSSVFFEFIESFIGQQYEGGYYAGKVFSDVDGYLKAVIVSDGNGDTDRTGAGDKQWRTSQTALTEAQTLADGEFVQNHIVTNETLSDFPAFEWIENNLNSGSGLNGYTDWYLPARDELELIYRHFKPTTGDNRENTRESSGFGGDGAVNGTNNSSDPTGSKYTLSDPSQTTVTGFQDGGADYLTANLYWSSTEFDASGSWNQRFVNGDQNYFSLNKDYALRVRAVRNVTVETPYNPSNIGMEMDGGFYAGNVRSDVDGNWYALIVSDAGGDTDRTGAGNKEWRTSQTALSEAQTLSDGKSVMDHIVANETLADFPAFEWVQTTLNDANYEGYNDWYIPARDEFELIYRHFKPTTDSNSTSTRSTSGFGGDGETYGTNLSTAPADYDGYTTSDPSRTTVTSFQDGGADYLTDANYWSSTELTTSNSWAPLFLNGSQSDTFKDNAFRVRAVRRIQISQ